LEGVDILRSGPELTVFDVRKYTENYIRKTFVEPVNITMDNGKYKINDGVGFKIYEFWNKTDKELLDNFENFSFKGDYVGTIFFFLSGYWEYIHNGIKDRYGRFPSEESFASKKGVLEEPVVDILTEEIRKNLGLSYKDRSHKAFLTHDIDNLGLPKGLRFIRALGGDLLIRKDIHLAFDRIKKKILNDDPWSPYNLINLHRKYGTKGTFFFMPCVQPGFFSDGYDINKNKKFLQELGDEITLVSGTIGIHYDIRHLKKDRMKDDMKKLSSVFGKPVEYGRAHFLVFDITKSFEIYEKAGIKYDTTCSFADAVGFRFGTSKSFHPYNFLQKREYNIVEIPLIVMEGSLRSPRYNNLTPHEGFAKITEMVDKVKRYNGTFTFLWHNSSFYISYWKNWEWVYHETVNYLKKNNFEFI